MIPTPSNRQLLPTLQRSATSAFAPVQREFNRLFDELATTWSGFTDVGLSPRMDVQDTREALMLTVELPGLTQRDVKIAVEDDILTISGEKKAEKDIREEDYRLSERTYGAFSRSVALPRSVNADKIKATMSDGVLKITAPKEGGALAKTIKIETAH